MHNLRVSKTSFFVALAFAALELGVAARLARAADTAPADAPQASKVLRVGGDYIVESIDKVGDRAFKVIFRADRPSGHYDTLALESDHVHVAVKVGQKIRLSAEILSEKGPAAEVAQVVIFFEGQQGRVPVWMLSSKASNLDLRATKYLEMHAPQTDFMVM
jgi:hypothetical protein